MTGETTDKAVILARGLGTRMRKQDEAAGLDASQTAAADAGIKALIPIGRPFLDYVLSALADAGYRRICLVIGPDHDAIRHYYGEQVKLDRLSIDFAVQREPRGTADAVASAEKFADGEPVAVINSDNYYPVAALRPLREQGGSGAALFDWRSMTAGSNLPEERLRSFAVARIEDGCLVGILEKPDEATWQALPRPIWLSMNCWQFRPTIFDSCRAIKPSPRGELELPDAVQHSIDVLGERFRAVTVSEPVLDITSRRDVAGVAEKLSGTEVRL
ncbi:MAG TPA: nucleotidyltransferase family protein [Thermoguttaceae bacterium]|nr:nucleotidyltransferase family protein [Thermoguttaceae bacterium]